jgi:phage shock protein C
MNELRRQDGVTPAVEPRLWRSRSKKVFAGVVGGLAEKFRIDVALMRVLYALFTFFSGVFPGIVVYFLLWYVMPEKHD